MFKRILALLFVLTLAFSAAAFAQDDEGFMQTQDMAEQIEDNPSEFYGETVTVQGVAETIVGRNSFILQNYEPFDLTPGQFFVIDSTGTSFQDMEVDINEGLTVQVTGTLQAMDFTVVEDEIDYDLDDTIFDSFLNDDDEDYALVANSVQIMEEGTMMAQGDMATEEAMMDGEDTVDGGLADVCRDAYVGENFLGLNAEESELIEDNPTEFYGENVTITGVVETVLDNNSFVVRDNEPLDFTPPTFLVFDQQGDEFADLTLSEGDVVCVSGELAQFVYTEVESFLGYTIAETEVYGDYGDDDFALYAESVQVLDDEGEILETEYDEELLVADDDDGTEEPADTADATGTNIEQAAGNYEDLCSAAYAGENIFGLDTEVTELIEDNPAEFFGTQVTVEGYIEQVLTENGFVLQDNEPFDFTPPEFVVADPEGDGFDGLTLQEDITVCVTGTVYDLESQDILDNTDYTLDDNFFEFPSGSDRFAIVAEDVRVIDE